MAENWAKGRFAVSRALTVGIVGFAGCCIFLGSASGPAEAAALGSSGGPFVTHTTDSQPYGFAEGADGAMWFTGLAGNEIGRVTTSGAVTEFPLAAGASPTGITSGPGAALWFAESGAHAIGSISTTGVVALYGGLTGEPQDITVGPDGNLWFTEPAADRIGTMTPAGALREYPLPAGSDPFGITVGPNGAIWFTAASADRIGEITLSGQVTTYSSGLSSGAVPYAITNGPDGNLWFTEKVGSNIGRITPTGGITQFPIPTSASAPEGIAVGPDGNLWFTESATGKLGRITPSGTIVEYPVFGASSAPVGIATGSDGNLWFSDGTDEIGTLGAAAPAAIVLPPVLVGSAQVTTPEDCVGDRWSNWAGVEPGAPIFTWFLNASAVPGATGETFVAPAGDAGDALSCTVTVTYAMVAVTVSSTSTAVLLSALATGPSGSTGVSGQAGTAGGAGAAGPAGAAGSAGEVELVSCQAKPSTETVGGKPVKTTQTVCTTKVVTHPVTFTTAKLKASLSRGRALVASGVEARVRGGTELVMPVSSALRPGRYVLRLSGHRRPTTLVLR